MYLSTLLIDVGKNPDRPRPGRLWLRNRYHVHQRLCMAFPVPERVSSDPHFLAPYSPADFGHSDPPQVHVSRSDTTNFLFRIDPLLGGRAVILVQSAVEPDWDYAFHNADYLLAAPPQSKPYSPSFAKGQEFNFRLEANPTKKIGTITKAERQSLSPEALAQRERRHGQRVPVDPLAWFQERAQRHGFAVRDLRIQTAWVRVAKSNGDNQLNQKLRSARYEGRLLVTEPEAFREAIVHGIGPAKGFGFGLLTVA